MIGSLIGWLLRYTPRNHLSYFVGKLVHWRLPGPLARWSIYCFGKYYKINFAEAEKLYGQYPSIGAFFTRRLKAGARQISNSNLTHPADSQISQLGHIDEGLLIQAKGKTYNVRDLTKNVDLEKHYFRGFFVTYYLCPTDYHRVHSPVDGKIIRTTHIPGTLWPVNQWSVKNIKNLFAINERVVVEIDSGQGLVTVVFVGATNVGKITMSFDPLIVTNQWQHRRLEKRSYSPGISITRGEELGIFHMGSTAVMLLAENLAPQAGDWAQWLGQKVKMGEAFSKP